MESLSATLGFKLGDGVISGVMVRISDTFGGGGAGLIAYFTSISKQTYMVGLGLSFKYPAKDSQCGTRTLSLSIFYRTSTGAGNGRRIYTFKTLKPVLLFPRMCSGEAGALPRGLDGRPVKTFLGGAGGLASSFSSSGVGGSSARILRGCSLG